CNRIQLFDDLVDRLGASFRGSRAMKVLTKLCAQRVKRIDVADTLREVVVEGQEIADLQPFEGDRVVQRLSAQLLVDRLVILRKRDRKLGGAAHTHILDGLFDRGQKTAFAENELGVDNRFFRRLTLDPHRVVDGDLIPYLGE